MSYKLFSNQNNLLPVSPLGMAYKRTALVRSVTHGNISIYVSVS